MKSQVHKDAFELYLEAKFDAYFPDKSRLNAAIRYSLLAPGKRIRPLLCLGFSRGFSGDEKLAFPCGMAIEMIHAYSLIHDDLPAMDNDDYRRGRPTNHKVYGEALAILAGDSLLSFAPEFILKELSLVEADSDKILELLLLMLNASGPDGMVKGQALDMEYETQDLSQFDNPKLDSILRNIHRLKTGAIITWSCLAGLYSHPDKKLISDHKCLVESIGQRIGLLFQMVDDVLDVTATLGDLGKTPGKDQKSGKLTYTNLHGLAGTSERARKLVQDIRLDLETLEAKLGGDWNLILEITQALESKLPG